MRALRGMRARTRYGLEEAPAIAQQGQAFKLRGTAGTATRRGHIAAASTVADRRGHRSGIRHPLRRRKRSGARSISSATRMLGEVRAG
jgi:hypothetical protein